MLLIFEFAKRQCANDGLTDIAEAETNRATIARAMDAWAAGTGGPYDPLTDEAVWTISGNSLASKTYPSKEAFIAEVVRPFNARISARLIPSVHNMYADGDTVIAHFYAKGTARDGQPYANSYAWILTLKDGRIVGAFAFFDAKAVDGFGTRVAPVAE
ncbi:nuclear transport factor 2 family protein [Sphingopyxis sp. YR583]|uniref:nuclear transport factor 2 family protein n=1 Tax=Sphingopyxis sp. YR583 TaxID=1881047 RepID=UPI000B8323DC|nr:nuclear transport factor 2 family protein [Sphingopyxis sp. YR583]